MLRHINRHRFWCFCLGLVVLQGFFTGQLKASISGQNIFDPLNGAANGTFGAIIVVGKGLHGNVFAVVFEGDEEFITDGEAGRFASRLVQTDVGGFQNVEHLEEYGLRGTYSAFEFFVRQLQFFLDAGHWASLT